MAGIGPSPAATASATAPTLHDVGDLDDDGDEVGFRLPLPPDDRLWRHPSELEGNATSFWMRLRHPWRVKRDDGDARA